jgi:hypothetical protein
MAVFPSGSSSYRHAMYSLCAVIELLHATQNKNVFLPQSV